MPPLLILAALVQAPGSPPLPQQPGQPRQPHATMVVEPVAMAFAGFDADGDGRTSRAEMEAGVRRSFAAIDTDRRGSLGYIGYSDWAERWLGDRNALPSPYEVDADGDDRITPAELQSAMVRAFARFDRNNDGSLTRTELLTIRASVGEQPDGRRGRRGRGGDRGGDRGGPPPGQ